jgi:HEAT repeat protein
LSPAELVAAFGNWSPIVRSWAAQELASRPESKTMVADLIKLADSGDPHQIQGACEALGLIKPPEALPVLVKQLAHPDRWVRYKAAEAVKKMGGTAKPAIESILKALVATAEPMWPVRWEDPVQFAHGQLAAAVFAGPLREELNKVDPKLLYAAFGVLSRNADGMARGKLKDFIENKLSAEDVKILGPDILAAMKSIAPADTMFGQEIRMGGAKALAKYHYQEGVNAIGGLLRDINGHSSETRIPVLLDYLKSYGKAAGEAIPDIKALIAIVQNGEMPSHPVNKKKIAQCEEAIKFIEAAKDHPPLRSIN